MIGFFLSHHLRVAYWNFCYSSIAGLQVQPPWLQVQSPWLSAVLSADLAFGLIEIKTKSEHLFARDLGWINPVARS